MNLLFCFLSLSVTHASSFKHCPYIIRLAMWQVPLNVHLSYIHVPTLLLGGTIDCQIFGVTMTTKYLLGCKIKQIIHILAQDVDT